MKPKVGFNATMKRVTRLLNLYELLTNKRKRSVRNEWCTQFKKLMKWPKKEVIHRIDGNNAILILRANSGLSPKEFKHDELSELLRAALVTSISAFDRYCHDYLVSRIIGKISIEEDKWPPELKKLSINLSLVKEAIEHAKLRKGKGGKKRTRPMNIIKRGLQDQFHRNLTLQQPDDVAKAFSMIGIKSFWTQCSKAMNSTAEELKNRLNKIVIRRNQIVHEGDIKRERKGKKGRISLNTIEFALINEDIDWIKKLVEIIENKIKDK